MQAILNIFKFKFNVTKHPNYLDKILQLTTWSDAYNLKQNINSDFITRTSAENRKLLLEDPDNYFNKFTKKYPL